MVLRNTLFEKCSLVPLVVRQPRKVSTNTIVQSTRSSPVCSDINCLFSGEIGMTNHRGLATKKLLRMAFSMQVAATGSPPDVAQFAVRGLSLSSAVRSVNG